MKRISFLISLIAVFGLASCQSSNPTTTTTETATSVPTTTEVATTTETSEVKKEKVDISSLSVTNEYTDSETTSLNSLRRVSSRNGFNAPEKLNDDVTPTSGNIQYALIFKGENEIDFTIKLKNPKAESIDAVEIYCSDSNSKILVDGEYKTLQYSDNHSRVVNWAQEDPYEKTFYISVSSVTEITIKVLDLKINGEWQGEELSNSELMLYEIGSSELKVTINQAVKDLNTENEHTEWTVKFECSKDVTDLKVNYRDTEYTVDDVITIEVYSTDDWGKPMTYTYSFVYNGYKYQRTFKVLSEYPCINSVTFSEYVEAGNIKYTYNK